MKIVVSAADDPAGDSLSIDKTNLIPLTNHDHKKVPE